MSARAVEAVLAETNRKHFVMWHKWEDDLEGPPGEWRCSCGLAFGFSDSAIDHVAAEQAAALASLGDAEVSLTEDEADALACACPDGICPLHDETSDGYVEHAVPDLVATVERILRDRLAALGALPTGETRESGRIDGRSLVAAERERQIDAEGYDLAHDREHGGPVLRSAGSSYVFGTLPGYGLMWPWDAASWKPRDRLSNLIRGGALYQASLDVEHNDMTELHLRGVVEEIDAILATARTVLGVTLPPAEDQAEGGEGRG